MASVKTIEGHLCHQHPHGGGWIAETATVADTAFVGPAACVLGQAQVRGTAARTLDAIDQGAHDLQRILGIFERRASQQAAAAPPTEAADDASPAP